MKVCSFYFKSQRSQRGEFRLKRLHYIGSPPFFSSSSALAFKDTSNILHEACCDNVRPWMTSWPQKSSRMVLYMFCFCKHSAHSALLRGLRPAKQLRYMPSSFSEFKDCSFFYVIRHPPPPFATKSVGQCTVVYWVLCEDKKRAFYQSEREHHLCATYLCMQNILIFDKRLLQETIDAISNSKVLFCFRCCGKGSYNLKLGFKPLRSPLKEQHV